MVSHDLMTPLAQALTQPLCRDGMDGSVDGAGSTSWSKGCLELGGRTVKWRVSMGKLWKTMEIYGKLWEIMEK